MRPAFGVLAGKRTAILASRHLYIGCGRAVIEVDARRSGFQERREFLAQDFQKRIAEFSDRRLARIGVIGSLHYIVIALADRDPAAPVFRKVGVLQLKPWDLNGRLAFERWFGRNRLASITVRMRQVGRSFSP
jgi:hypothetical protein